MGVDAVMEAVTLQRLDDQEILELSRQLRECFGQSYGIRRSALRDSQLQYQILEDEPGAILAVDLNGERFYGIGYERGPVVRHIAVAEWFEVLVPGISVYYGGDHDCLDVFDARARSELFAHFARNASRPYRVRQPTEYDCPKCERAIAVNQWAGVDTRSGTCLVCGKRYWTIDNGMTWSRK